MERSRDQRGLGRGLSALMADVKLDEPGEATAPAGAETRLPIESLAPNEDQPRRSFSQDGLQELANSIREKGLLQPLIVRRLDSAPDHYQIIAGERRWRAAQLAQLHEVPVIVRDLTDTEVLEVAIVENIQRADLNAVEEATGYRQLMDRFGHTQEQLARSLGKSRSHIANLLRLLTLPEPVLAPLREGRLSAGHARALIGCEDPAALARTVIDKGLSVRETERRATRTGTAPPRAAPARKDADTHALEKELSAALGMRVAIEHDAGAGTGRVTIGYGSLEALDTLTRALGAVPKATEG